MPRRLRASRLRDVDPRAERDDLPVFFEEDLFAEDFFDEDFFEEDFFEEDFFEVFAGDFEDLAAAGTLTTAREAAITATTSNLRVVR